MSMKTSTRHVDGVTIVDCSGRITLGEGSVILRDTVRDLLKELLQKLTDLEDESQPLQTVTIAFHPAIEHGDDS